MGALKPWHLIVIALALVLLILVVIAVVLIVRVLAKRSAASRSAQNPGPIPPTIPPMRPVASAREILDARLARGEIDEKEHDRLRAALER